MRALSQQFRVYSGVWNLIRSLYKVKIYLKFTFTFLFLNTALSATRCGQAWVNTCFLYVDYVRAIRGPPRDNKHRWQTGSNYIRVFDIVLQFKRAKCKKEKNMLHVSIIIILFLNMHLYTHNLCVIHMCSILKISSDSVMIFFNLQRRTTL